MPRARRFPVSCEFWISEQHEAALNALAENSVLTKSDFLRLALDAFLRQQGVLPSYPLPQAKANGNGAVTPPEMKPQANGGEHLRRS